MNACCGSSEQRSLKNCTLIALFPIYSFSMMDPLDGPIAISFRKIKAGRIAVLTMQGQQQNVINSELLAALHKELSTLLSDGNIRGIVITSHWSGKFSSGPDIRVLMRPRSPEFRRLYDMFFLTYTKILLSPKPIIAAINGDCPSFACALAMACDERVMSITSSKHERKRHNFGSAGQNGEKYLSRDSAGPCVGASRAQTSHFMSGSSGGTDVPPSLQYKIGFPDPSIAMVLQRWVVAQMVHIIGPKHTEYQLRYGHMWSAQQAMDIGMVDHLCRSDDILKTALRRMQTFAQVDNHAWQATKYALRGNYTFGIFNQAQRHVSRAIYLNHFYRASQEIQRRIKMLRK